VCPLLQTGCALLLRRSHGLKIITKISSCCCVSCVQGDRLAVGRRMPKAEVGDYVVVADVGAYTLSMYSRWVGC
jgi:diaminopimelate decarboxylase